MLCAVCGVLCACMLYMLLHADPVIPLLLLRFLRLLLLFFTSLLLLSQVPPFPAATLHGERRREAGGRVIWRLHSSPSFVGIIIFVVVFVVFIGSRGEDEGTGAIHTVASLAGSVHAVFQVKEKMGTRPTNHNELLLTC